MNPWDAAEADWQPQRSDAHPLVEQAGERRADQPPLDSPRPAAVQKNPPRTTCNTPHEIELCSSLESVWGPDRNPASVRYVDISLPPSDIADERFGSR